MIRQALRSSPPPTAVRAMLVGEVVIYAGLLTACLWFITPMRGPGALWLQVPAAILIVAVPVALNILHGDWLADSGLRVDNLAASAKEVAIATAVMAAIVVAVGLAMDSFHWVSWRRLLETSGRYLVWGLVQQYLLQAFSLRRLRQARLPAWLAVGLTAVIFGLAHSPNWTLVAATIASGVVWSILFLRRPNLLTLGLAHAVLAVLLYHAWNTMGMTVGRMYLERLRSGWQGP